jgi:hypothetical protein
MTNITAINSLFLNNYMQLLSILKSLNILMLGKQNDLVEYLAERSVDDSAAMF